MNTRFVLAILVMLTPTAYGCVNFALKFVPNGNLGRYPISAKLWDNLGPNDDPTCQYEGYIGDDNRYHFNCISGDIAAFWYENVDGVDSGWAEYIRPGQDFRFVTPATKNGDGSWQYGACNYGCDSNSCFVSGAT